MLNALSSRSTFYDITGYLIPGILTLGLIWMYWFFIGDCQSAMQFLRYLHKIGVFFTTVGVAVAGYAIGHLANSVSSWLYEGVLFKAQFEHWRNWYSRMSDVRKKIANGSAQREFGVEASQLKTFDIRIRMENKMPNVAVTGLCFISYYGMCRTLSLISFLAIPLVSILSCSDYELCVFAPLLLLCVSLFFGYQYSRFVIYYNDFLGSTLIQRGHATPVNDTSRKNPEENGDV